MEKAEQAVASAHLLVEAGDPDSACNRAYYAMFQAAKAPRWAANQAEHLCAAVKALPTLSPEGR